MPLLNFVSDIHKKAKSHNLTSDLFRNDILCRYTCVYNLHTGILLACTCILITVRNRIAYCYIDFQCNVKLLLSSQRRLNIRVMCGRLILS
jgi:hypothetical protein